MLHTSLEPYRTVDKTVQYDLVMHLTILKMVFFCRQTGHRPDIKQL